MSLPKEVWDHIKGLKLTLRPVKNPPESHLGSFRDKINSVRRLAHGKMGVRSVASNHERVSTARLEREDAM